ncbi:hypothetical protein [Paramagnetospirillum magneticum]|uniref:Uncharacterized protein n=1 Tax=Paramagnetospirillum magneticum (strain ATCC 700264 / AMB-1) TaxID=342108 RepID=Q2W6K6_PARM1|nr:hypothetical protein [Paramagnetospirillum magneticum]BAE50519.1 hypothetical protein amb1715 [Paramagnetospirillum magneticum AMB-1]
METEHQSPCNRMRILRGLDGRALLTSALAVELAARMVVCEEGECDQRPSCFALAHRVLCAGPR